MMAAALGTRPVDEAWRKLEGTLERAMKPDEKGVTHDDAMKAMTAVHDYCTGTGASATRTRQSGEGARAYQPTQGTRHAPCALGPRHRADTCFELGAAMV